MGILMETYLRYGVSSDKAIKYEELGISATMFRQVPIEQLVRKYNLEKEEVSEVKKCIKRKPIDKEILQSLLENSNFVCCCCKGIKSDSYIIHHIEEYSNSQDNSYENLAVLCLNDHDLAHRSPKLTNKLTADQIRSSKESWEAQVKIHNIAIARNGQREKFFIQIPRYKNLELEIERLKERVSDKEKLLTRSEAFFDLEISKLNKRILEVSKEKKDLEEQIIDLATKLNNMDETEKSEMFMKSIKYFLDGDLESAISVLDKSQLETKLSILKNKEEQINKEYEEQAKSWMLRGKLLSINGDREESVYSAEQAICLYKKLTLTNSDEYLIKLANGLEEIGTIYYRNSNYDKAEEYFNEALSICNDIFELGELYIIALISIILQNLGACCHARGDSKKSLNFLLNADAICSSIESYLGNSEIEIVNFIKFRHSVVLSNLGITYSSLGNSNDAQIAFLNAVNIIEELYETDNIQYKISLYKALSGLSLVYFRKRNYELAQETYLKALPYIRDLFTMKKDTYICELADTLRDICATYIYLGKINLQEDLNRAKEFCDEALELYRNIEFSRGAEISMHMVDTLMYRIIIYLQEGKNEEYIKGLIDEAKFICSNFPENIDAQEYPKMFDDILNGLKKKS
ncbi:tetratricopeptide repeat protein [Clostridium perfringens]|nr:tetratricopeptide repeat protein [Clostridium perfringens]HBI7133198.1 tetratricopeptide repeat protein [Clostridium perfringens]